MSVLHEEYEEQKMTRTYRRPRRVISSVVPSFQSRKTKMKVKKT